MNIYVIAPKHAFAYTADDCLAGLVVVAESKEEALKVNPNDWCCSLDELDVILVGTAEPQFKSGAVLMDHYLPTNPSLDE